MSDPIILTIISIIVLLAFSGFFSGSETALTGASRPRMHQLESDGNKRARIVNLLHAQQERLIGGILIGKHPFVVRPQPLDLLLYCRILNLFTINNKCHVQHLVFEKLDYRYTLG